MSNKAFSKFTLKPSALSQHTANFNKKLEQLPIQKTEPIQLIKPVESLKSTINENTSTTHSTTSTTDSKINTVLLKENDATLAKDSETSNQKEPVKEFVFGEKLTDRVINTIPEGVSNDLATTSRDDKENGINVKSVEEKSNNNNGLKQSTSGLLWTENKDENKTTSGELLEEYENNTIMKLNCKLYVLESNKASWIERGYGIFKLIDLNDDYNCKLMMWTDKCFRLILNTKFFDKMEIEKVSSKSIRLNAFDSGTIKIFLVKTGNQNDCEDLFGELERRLKIFNDYLAKNGNTQQKDDSFTKRESSLSNNKSFVFKCNCDLFKTVSSDDLFKAKIDLYSYASASAHSKSTNHQLFLDIVDLNDENNIHASTYLKLIKLKVNKKDSPLEFEINDLNDSAIYRVVINDNESVAKFLNLYSKEPKFKVNPENSSDDDDEKNSDDEEEESNDTGVSNDTDDDSENTNTNDRRNASFSERSSEKDVSQETGEISSRKRKNHESDEDSLSNSTASLASKKQEIEPPTESVNSSIQKRSALDMSDEEDSNLKKSKVSNDDSQSNT